MYKTFCIIGISLLCILGLFSFSFSQETLTITTYYPSPYGSYKELRTQRMAIGTYSGPDYCWAPEGCANTIDANADLVVEGNVGIGTVTPTEKLHINGKIRIVDGTEGPRRVLTSDASGVGFWDGRAISEYGVITVPVNTTTVTFNFSRVYINPPLVFVTAQKNAPNASTDTVMVWVWTVTNTSATIDLDTIMWSGPACPGGNICSNMNGQHSYWIYDPIEPINVNYMVISRD